MKDIPGLEGLYAITPNGDIWSYHSGRFLRTSIHPTAGYKRIRIWTPKGRKNFLIHRLVASTYIPNPDNLPQVNHIDCDTLNNNVLNLEWCTNRENFTHAVRMGRYEWRRGLPESKVLQIRNLLAQGKKQMEIVRQLGISKWIIKDIARGKTYKSYP